MTIRHEKLNGIRSKFKLPHVVKLERIFSKFEVYIKYCLDYNVNIVVGSVFKNMYINELTIKHDAFSVFMCFRIAINVYH